MSKKGFLQPGTVVVTQDGQKAIVQHYFTKDEVLIMHPSEGMWPFPTLETKARKHLTVEQPVYEDAPF